MDGKQNNPASEGQPAPSKPQSTNNPVYNPPSLVEPAATPAPVAAAVPATPASAAVPPPAPAVAPAPTASVDPAPVAAEPDTEPAIVADEGAGFYRPDDASLAQPAAKLPPVSWTSSGEELQAHSSSWRIKMSLVAIIFASLVYLMTRDLISTGAVAFAGIMFGFLGARKPQALQYQLDDHGITIGAKQFPYSDFRAFSVMPDSASIDLIPLKRFLPITVIRYDQAQSQQIIGQLGSHLPMEAPRRDLVDSVVSGLKF